MMHQMTLKCQKYYKIELADANWATITFQLLIACKQNILRQMRISPVDSAHTSHKSPTRCYLLFVAFRPVPLNDNLS